MKFRLMTSAGGALGVIRLEGAGAEAFLRARLSGPLPAPGRLRQATFLDAEGRALDEVLLARPRAERWELSCHGSPALLAEIQRLARLAGATEERDAGPGQGPGRTRREAEALLPLARTELCARLLLRQLGGAWDTERARLEGLLGEDPRACAERLGQLLATQAWGRALAAPPRVVLLGPPNVGKSTLLNALAGRERALVSPQAGTTRDALEAEVELAGLCVRLVDTAGQRRTPDALEAAGVALAEEEAQRADLCLDLELARPHPAPAGPREAGPRGLRVFTQSDRLPGPPPGEGLWISALSGQGLDALGRRVRELLVGEEPPGACVFTPRQATLLEAARRALSKGQSSKVRALVGAITG